MIFPRLTLCLAALLLCSLGVHSLAADNAPIKPLGKDGKPLNLDFETGTLKDWTATGNAFDKQPIHGDAVAARRGDMHSGHQGDFWIGGFEIVGDDATGTLTSVPFKVTHPWGSFLVAGGSWPETRVELVLADTNKVFFKISGYENEQLRPVVVDLKPVAGKEIFIRLVDERKGHWGHLNFDDFEFYDARPEFTNDLKPGEVAQIPPADVVKFAGLSPEDAAKAMTLPEGFRATLFAGEPDIVQPIAFTLDERGRLWVVEGMTYPQRAPEGQGKDRILIFEDTKGVGHFDKRTVFMEGLNLVSGIEVGFGGVYIGAAPYLMFVPVKDDKPAGPPQILLDGFGYGDTHETLNTFSWGPDGWLYGCHGVFTQSLVGKPGAPPNERVHLNAGVWRYHPTKKIFERFAEGTSNPWGLDFDAQGQIIIEACVIPHLWHMIQGAHYQRQGGAHDNPCVFDDIKTIADHLHWGGMPNPWAANGRSDSLGGGHAHAGLLVYQGGSWPKQFDGSYFMNNIHGSRINMDVPERQGSGFVGHHGKDFILFNDLWSQIINLRSDQDGSVYLIDWYDKNQCHSPDIAAHDRTNGRIFKIVYGDTKTTRIDLAKLSDRELIDLQRHVDQPERRENVWYARGVRRQLQERAAAGTLAADTRGALGEIVASDAHELQRLSALWELHVTGGVPENTWRRVLQLGRPYDAAWTIQLLCEEKDPPPLAVQEFVRLAKENPSPVVRLYLVSACQRMPLEQTWPIVEALLAHAEDEKDHNLPLMNWYALESLVSKDPQRALSMAMQTKLPNILAFTVRRIAAMGNDSAIAALAASLGQVQDEGRQIAVLNGINDALRGRRSVAMPAGWDAIEAKLLKSPNDTVRSAAAALSVTFGSRSATDYMLATAKDAKAKPGDRRSAIEALAAAKMPGLPAVLQPLLADPQVNGSALRALAGYDDASTPKAVLANYAAFAPAEKKDALSTLAGRPAYAQALLAAVSDGTISAKDVSADIVRQLRNLHNEQIDKQVAKVWGILRDSPQDKLKRIAQVRAIVERPGAAPDLSHGRLLFGATCSQCHTLFDSGGHVGPDITGSNRADLSYLLQRVIDPNFLVPNEYRSTIVRTNDDRTVVGILKKEDAAAITLQTPNELLVIPRNEIKIQKVTELGMMPEGLLDNFAEKDIRDLVAYLRSPRQVAAGPGT